MQVILVGHSAGGLSLSDGIQKFGKKKIKLAVFVAATMLKSGYLTHQDIQDVSSLTLSPFLPFLFLYILKISFHSQSTTPQLIYSISQ